MTYDVSLTHVNEYDSARNDTRHLTKATMNEALLWIEMQTDVTILEVRIVARYT